MKVPDYFDDPNSDDESGQGNEPMCKRCGSTDVRWRIQTGKWTLFSLKPGVLHQCEIPDDFEVVKE